MFVAAYVEESEPIGRARQRRGDEAAHGREGERGERLRGF
jgi:hypothetical protein